MFYCGIFKIRYPFLGFILFYKQYHIVLADLKLLVAKGDLELLSLPLTSHLPRCIGVCYLSLST